MGLKKIMIMSSDNHSARAFIAVPLPEEVKKFLTDLQIHLKDSGIKASWPKPENMHLTLKFLGNIDVHTFEAVKACMSRAAGQTPVHTLSASGIGVFPSVKKTRVIWAGTRGQTDILETLVKELDAILFKELAVKKEEKRYSPHLTIARIKRPIPPKTAIKLLQKFKDFHSSDFIVNQIKLFQSRLAPTGAVHTQLFSASLKK